MSDYVCGVIYRLRIEFYAIADPLGELSGSEGRSRTQKSVGDQFTPAGLENFVAEAFYPVTDPSAAPPLVTKAMLDRLLMFAAGHGLEFAPSV